MKVNPFADLPDVGVTRTRKSFAMGGIAPSTGYLWIKKGLWPTPIRMGPNTTGIPNRALKALGEQWAKEAA